MQSVLPGMSTLEVTISILNYTSNSLKEGFQFAYYISQEY